MHLSTGLTLAAQQLCELTGGRQQRSVTLAA